MNVKEIAHKALIATKILPAKDILIDVVNPDWEGAMKIYITSEPTAPEDETQLGIVSATTEMAVNVIAKTREEAEATGRAAASVAYDLFSELEQERGSGILCITLLNTNVFQIPQRAEFQSTFTFRILHNP